MIIHRRKQLTSNQAAISLTEIKILIQAFVIFLSCVWNWVGTTYSTKLFHPQTTGFTIWFYVMQFSLQWINPILYLLMN
uniref:G_PROTEIN_RECEP_F1_2 domain-containing protein n=1 Tax=Steinernema glaseri TaxID=37863 RepID=A0A1I8AKT2_9BILA